MLSATYIHPSAPEGNLQRNPKPPARAERLCTVVNIRLAGRGAALPLIKPVRLMSGYVLGKETALEPAQRDVWH